MPLPTLASVLATPTLDTDTAWQLWGERDPYFGVLTDPRFRRRVITDQDRDLFFALGKHHVDDVLRICRTHIDPAMAPQRVLDFGCGVGRVLVPFAAIASQVVGLDVAPAMLAEARANCDRMDAANVKLALSDDALSAAEDGAFDLVHSCIVLQHIEVARGRRLFARLLEKIRPGGCGAIQVTFGLDAHADTFGALPLSMPPPAPTPTMRGRMWLADLLGRAGVNARSRRTESPQSAQPIEAADADPEMQMHYYNLSELMYLLQRVGVLRVHSEITDHGGALGTFMFFQLPA